MPWFKFHSRLQCLNLNYLKQKRNHQKSVLHKKRR
jgi:hypothetical protein